MNTVIKAEKPEAEWFVEYAKAAGRVDGQSDKRNGYTPEHSHSAYRFREIEGGDEAKRTYNEFYSTWRARS